MTKARPAPSKPKHEVAANPPSGSKSAVPGKSKLDGPHPWSKPKPDMTPKPPCYPPAQPSPAATLAPSGLDDGVLDEVLPLS